MTIRAFPVPMDSRVAGMVAGFGPRGNPVAMTPERFTSVTSDWVVLASTPSEVAQLLSVCKSLYCHGAFVYEFVTVAVQQAFTALEAALAHRLDRPKDSLGDLIKRAHEQGLVGDAEFDVLYEAARPLRNGFGHARHQQVWTPGMAVPVIDRIFATVEALWP